MSSYSLQDDVEEVNPEQYLYIVATEKLLEENFLKAIYINSLRLLKTQYLILGISGSELLQATVSLAFPLSYLEKTILSLYIKWAGVYYEDYPDFQPPSSVSATDWNIMLMIDVNSKQPFDGKTLYALFNEYIKFELCTKYYPLWIELIPHFESKKALLNKICSKVLLLDNKNLSSNFNEIGSDLVCYDNYDAIVDEKEEPKLWYCFLALGPPGADLCIFRSKTVKRQRVSQKQLNSGSVTARGDVAAMKRCLVEAGIWNTRCLIKGSVCEYIAKVLMNSSSNDSTEALEGWDDNNNSCADEDLNNIHGINCNSTTKKMITSNIVSLEEEEAKMHVALDSATKECGDGDAFIDGGGGGTNTSNSCCKNAAAVFNFRDYLRRRPKKRFSISSRRNILPCHTQAWVCGEYENQNCFDDATGGDIDYDDNTAAVYTIDSENNSDDFICLVDNDDDGADYDSQAIEISNNGRAIACRYFERNDINPRNNNNSSSRSSSCRRDNSDKAAPPAAVVVIDSDDSTQLISVVNCTDGNNSNCTSNVIEIDTNDSSDKEQVIATAIGSIGVNPHNLIVVATTTATEKYSKVDYADDVFNNGDSTCANNADGVFKVDYADDVFNNGDSTFANNWSYSHNRSDLCNRKDNNDVSSNNVDRSYCAIVPSLFDRRSYIHHYYHSQCHDNSTHYCDAKHPPPSSPSICVSTTSRSSNTGVVVVDDSSGSRKGHLIQRQIDDDVDELNKRKLSETAATVVSPSGRSSAKAALLSSSLSWRDRAERNSRALALYDQAVYEAESQGLLQADDLNALKKRRLSHIIASAIDLDPYTTTMATNSSSSNNNSSSSYCGPNNHISAIINNNEIFNGGYIDNVGYKDNSNSGCNFVKQSNVTSSSHNSISM